MGRGRSRLRQLPVPDLRPAAGARALGREFHRSRRGDAEAANAIAVDVGHWLIGSVGEKEPLRSLRNRWSIRFHPVSGCFLSRLARKASINAGRIEMKMIARITIANLSFTHWMLPNW